VVTPAADSAPTLLLASDTRAFVVDAARSHGFTHVAIELPIAGDDATVHRD
jgi:hypothetical protein